MHIHLKIMVILFSCMFTQHLALNRCGECVKCVGYFLIINVHVRMTELDICLYIVCLMSIYTCVRDMSWMIVLTQ